jgi:hypothetical protein
MERVDSIITDNIKNNIKVKHQVITYEANENERWPECNVYELIIYCDDGNLFLL